MSNLDIVITTLQELKRLHQLNLELLEQLNVTCGWLLEHNIPIPNSQTLYSLLAKTRALVNEVQSDEPKILQYSLSRRKVTDFRTDEEVPEPAFGPYSFLGSYS